MARWLTVGAFVGATWSLLGLAILTVEPLREGILSAIGQWMTYLLYLFPTTYLAAVVLDGFYVHRPIDWALPLVVTAAIGAAVGAGVAWGLWQWWGEGVDNETPPIRRIPRLGARGSGAGRLCLAGRQVPAGIRNGRPFA